LENRHSLHTFPITIVHVSSTFPSQLRISTLAFGVCAGETRMMKACVLRALPDSTSDLDPSHRPRRLTLSHALLLPAAFATADKLRQQRDGAEDDEQPRLRRSSTHSRKRPPSNSRQQPEATKRWSRDRRCACRDRRTPRPGDAIEPWRPARTLSNLDHDSRGYRIRRALDPSAAVQSRSRTHLGSDHVVKRSEVHA